MMSLQAPREMTYIHIGRAQGLIFHRVLTGQSQGPIQGTSCTSMVQGLHRCFEGHVPKFGGRSFG